MANVRQLKDHGAPIFPITHVSLVKGMEYRALMDATYAWDGTGTPDVSKIPAGVVVTYDGTDYTGTLVASASTTGRFYLVPSTTVQGEWDRYMTDGSGSSYAWKAAGNTSIPSPAVVDNETTDDPTKPHSAAGGKRLKDQLGELEAKVIGFNGTFEHGSINYNNGADAASTKDIRTGQIPVEMDSILKISSTKSTISLIYIIKYNNGTYVSYSSTTNRQIVITKDATFNSVRIRVKATSDWTDAEVSASSWFISAEDSIIEKIGKLEAQDIPFTTSMFSLPLDITDYGIHGRVNPSGLAFIGSDNYRLSWIKCNQGDEISVSAFGYSDNVQLAFATTRNYSSLTNVKAGSSQSTKTITAASDGYFLVGGVVTGSYKIVVECKRYQFIQDVELGKFEDGLKKDGWDILASNNIIRSNIPGQATYVFKVSAGDTVTAKGTQYNDTAFLAFSASMPEAGDTVTIISNGTTNTVTHTFASAGYCLVTLRTDVDQSASTFNLVSTDFAQSSEILKLSAKCDETAETVGGLKAERYDIPEMCFESLSMEAAGDMKNWTGTQIIENIYEPLRLAHPEYITRKVIGKDATNTYDIYLYEFNNCVSEWFNSQDKNNFTSDVILPGESGLTATQCAIKKTTFDTFFTGKNYDAIYFLVDFSVRKLEMWTNREELTINSDTYYVFTFETAPKVVNSGVEVWWTSKVETFDQHIFLVSGVHGDEPGGYLGTALALKYLVENHANNKTLDYIYKHIKLSVVPVLNIWGSNQSPKVRTNYDGENLNRFDNSPLSQEQQALSDYVSGIKDELSAYLDLHTSELWNNYGFVYAIGTPYSKLFPALTMTSGHLCKHWFPGLPPFNWNVGTLNALTSSNYMKETFAVESATVEFCGQDLMAFGNCARWSAQYMTYAVENYLNFILAVCALRLKSNAEGIADNSFFTHTTMS